MEHSSGSDATRVRDVVCGMTIDRTGAAGTSTVHGLTYYFCSAQCKATFDANPAKYESATTGSAN